jgi:hypothetical protein
LLIHLPQPYPPLTLLLLLLLLLLLPHLAGAVRAVQG